MVLAQKKKYIVLMEQDRKPRDKPTYLSLTKEARIYNRVDSLFNKWCWENWTALCKRMKLEHFLTPCTKIKSKWINDLNLRPETIKPLEENIGRTLFDVNHSKILYDPPFTVMEIKAKINKKVKVKSLSCVQLFVAPWTVTHQASPSMGFYRNGLPFPSPGNLPDPGIEPRSPTL